MQVVGNSEKSSRKPSDYLPIFSALGPARAIQKARIRIARSGWVRIATLIAAFKYFAGADGLDRDSSSP
jgi:hypothetical protein